MTTPTQEQIDELVIRAKDVLFCDYSSSGETQMYTIKKLREALAPFMEPRK